ncbi:MAG: hypothetical protein WAZ15_01265 [Propioniciclava sp.]
MRTARSDYLWLAVTVTAPQGDPLWLLDHSLRSPFPAEDALAFTALPGNGLRIAGGGVDQTLRFRSPLARAEQAYGHTHNALMDRARERGWVRLHAAQVDRGGRRILIAGRSGAGKTTLAIRWAARGATIGSDEGVLIRGGLCVGLPRRLHLKHSSRESLPGPARDTAAVLDYDPPVTAVDPGALFAVPPPVAPRAPDLLVLLAPGEGAPTLSDASPFQVVAELGTEAASLSLDRAALVGELARLQRTTRCVTLTGHADESTLDALDALS